MIVVTEKTDGEPSAWACDCCGQSWRAERVPAGLVKARMALHPCNAAAPAPAWAELDPSRSWRRTA